MSRKSTHSGTCQICGKLQKLPYGLLSKHGYMTRWGFFEGTCYGAENKPFEESCAMIQDAILNAKVQIEKTQENAAKACDKCLK